MGRPRAYRQRLSYQVHAARQKTLAQQLVVTLERELGMSAAEAELVAARLDRYVKVQAAVRAPEQIVIQCLAGRESFRRRAGGPSKPVKLTAVGPEDLDVLVRARSGRLRWLRRSEAGPSSPRSWRRTSVLRRRGRGQGQVLEECLQSLAAARPPGSPVYWAGTANEPAGKPLGACRLVPVQIPYWEDEDLARTADNPELDRVRDLKRARILRYSTAAKRQGAYLSYADLSYLMGIHTEAVRALIGRDPPLVAPLRRGGSIPVRRTRVVRRSATRVPARRWSLTMAGTCRTL